ncbi:glycoside hydrolase family 3 C-terminal domain-containing protein [Microbacterium saperdae]
MTSEPLSALSLEEKVSLLSGGSFWATRDLPAHDVPALILTDGPHGVRRQTGGADHLGINDSLPSTCFPPAVAVGSSWDPAVAEELARSIAVEARAFGVSVLLGPGINIKRSPLGGRNFEYYSEDPLLSGVLGAAHVRAQQEAGVGASLKHFAANNQETERISISADIDERTLREIYLSAFERVVREADPATVMCSYNRINGTFASENHWLLTELLREEWGFGGAVVSDWGAVTDPVAAVAAGLDLAMPGAADSAQRLKDAVAAGLLPVDAVDAAVARVLALQAYAPQANAAGGEIDVDAHHAIAQRLATECAVLLKNDEDVLPVHDVRRVAVIGEFAEAPRFQGGGSSHINPTRVDTPLDALRAKAAQRDQIATFATGYRTGATAEAAMLRAEAAEVAAASDIAIIFVGTEGETEGVDRRDIALPADQAAVISAVAAVAPKTVVVLSNGGIVSLEGWHDEVDAILEGFLLGQAGGSAIADLLYGDANPSGHLAETIPLRIEDHPSHLSFPGEQGHARYAEGVMVGYRYFATAAVPVRYPFGHGLSYTQFSTSDLRAEADGDAAARVAVTVANVGSRPGKHVVQVYVSTAAGPVRRPVRELRGFAKIELQPGESRRVEVELDRRAFSYWDIEEQAWVVAPGDYAIEIGQDAHTVLASAPLALAGDAIVRPLSMDSTVGEWFAHPIAGPALQQGMAAGMSAEQQQAAAENEDQLAMVESMPMRQFVGFLGGAVPQEALDGLIAASRHGVLV